jgi:hypothetical protein
MLIALAVVLGLVWLLGFGVYHVASGAFHLFLLLAVAAAVAYFVRRARQHRVT